MSITVRASGDVRIIEITGEFALGSGGLTHTLDLRGNRLQDLSESLRQLLEEGSRRIVLDLAKVPFLDSAGLGELVACKKRTRQMGGDLHLMRLTPRVLDLFELTALTRVFRVFDEERTAVESFSD